MQFNLIYQRFNESSATFSLQIVHAGNLESFIFFISLRPATTEGLSDARKLNKRASKV